MRKSLRFSLLTAALILCVALGVRGYVLQVASGTWAPQANLWQARSGASAVLLQDGRVLITGGDGTAGTLVSAEIVGTDGTSSAAAPMNIARGRHVSVMLANGNVLVAGGTTSGGGATNAAEIYDPLTDSWTTVPGGMTEARSNATAVLLKDGRVLIVGGDKSGVASASLEVFDPIAGAFSFAGALSSPRTEHAMALLPDGRVFITGGSNGSTAVNSTDIYDSVAGNVGPGPAMSTPRSGHSATAMLDGTVLIAGGNNGSADLASAEVFDPAMLTMATVASSLAVARQGHLAFLLPNNNTVLIVGGTSAGTPLASAEKFTPRLGTFSPTGSLSSARSLSAGNPMKQDGLLLVAGGQDASGVAISNKDLYGFATVKTDAADYAPGTTVNITGSGWQPGETVSLTLVEQPLFDTHGPFTVLADSNGSISDSSFATDEHDLNISFVLTATGSVSEAQTIFKDSKPNTVTVGAQTPDPVAPGGSAQYTVTVNFNGNGSACTSPLSIQNPAVLPAGATATFSPTSVTSTGGNATSTLTITTTNSTPPTATPISFTVLAANGGGTCQGGTATGTGTLTVVESTTSTLTSSVNPSVFGQSTTLTATVAKTSGPTSVNAGSVTFKDGATTLGTVSVNASGVATLGVSSLTAVSHSLAASYAGTAIFAASNSNTVSQTVSQASTTATLTSGTNPSSSGQSVTFTATVAAVAPGSGTATGTVTFKDGATTIGTGTLAGNIATLATSALTVGSHSITATYNGDSNFTGSTSSALNQVVNQANTTTTITNAASLSSTASVVGQAVNITFTVTSGGGTPTGSVTVSDGAAGDSCTATVATGNCAITFPASGTKTLSAVYAGDTNFAGGTSGNFSHTVNAAATTTAITAHTPNPSVIGQAITVNYTVTVNSPSSGTIPGTDNVTVSDGPGDSCTGTVAAGTCQLTATTSGAKTLVATFAAGDANFATSTSAGISHTVNQAPTITSANNTTFKVGTAGSFTVTATGFPAATFSETGALPSGVALSTAGVLSGTPATNTGGTYPITITASNGVSPNGTQSFVLTVNQAPAITSVSTTSFVANAPGTFTFTATGFPTTMTFTETGSLPSGVALGSDGVLSGTSTVTGNFPITVTASNGITPNATQSFTLTVGQAPGFTSANNTAFTVLTAGSFTASASGFPAPTFSTSSALPSGVTLTAAGLLSGTPASGTAGSYPITIIAHNGVGADATQNFTLTVNKLTPTFSPALSSPAAIAFGTSTVSLPPTSVMVTTGSIRAASPDTVTISINGASSAPISFNGSSGTFGPIAFNTQLIPVGTYPITYTYSGGANFNGISDSSTTLTVNKANQTINVATPAPATAGFDSSFSVAATASSGLAVTFSSSGACSNVGATFTMNSGTGTCTVKFDQAGNSNYNAAAQVTESVTAQQAAATITLSNLTQTYTGGALTPTATTNPAGLSIVWTAAPDTNVGSYPVTAKVNDPNYQGSASGTFAITGAATTTSLSAPAVTYPANGIVTVTVSSAGGTPTGNATLVVDGGLPIVAALNGSGMATFTLTNPSPGSHALSASYAAQGNFGGSGPATGNLVVSQAPIITSAASTIFTAAIAGSFSVTTMGYPAAALSESGALPSGVTFTDNGNGTATLAGTTTAGGIYTFTITAANIVGNQPHTFTLTVSAGAFTKLQVLVPGETAAPGTATGKAGTPNIEYVNGPFNATVNAVDDNWNVVNTVNDTVKVASNDAQAVLPADAALVAGTGTFSVKLETVANPAATTITASDVTDAGKTSNTSPAIKVIVVYTASITPSTASNGIATAYTLTVNNAGAPNTNDLKSVTVAIPTNGGVPSGISVAATSPANWMVDPNPPSGFLRFRECTSDDGCNGAGTNDVNPGGNITIQFTTTASESISGTAANEVWTTTALSDSAYATPLPLAGTEPTIAIGAGAVITSANSTTLTNGAASTFKVTTTGVPTPTLSETGALPSGVTFTDNADGTATLAGTTRAAGDFPVTITAHNGYGADGTQTFTLTVTKATTSTDVVSSLNPSFSGQAVTFTATVTVPANVPTGTVQFQDGGVNLGTAVTLANNSGVFAAQLQTSGLSVGTHSINAIYSGDNNFSTSTSPAITQIVKSAVTNTSISAPVITYGADGLVTVTVGPQDASAGTPSGSVTLSVDGGTAVSQTLVNGSTAFTISIPGAGDHTLSATYAAQNNFLGSSATGSLHVNQAVATLTFGPLTFTYDGTPKPVSITTAPANLTGVSILYGASPIPPTNAGSTAVSATLTNANYTATPISGTEVIQAAPVVITVIDSMPTYDGNAHAATISIVPMVAVATTYNGFATLPSAAGTYAVLVMTADPNYAGSGTGTLTIKQAALTVTTNDKSRAYGANNPNFDGTVAGVLNNDPITATYATTATPASPAGTYDIMPTLSDAGSGTLANYAVASNKGTLTITAIPLYVVANNKSRVYGAGDPSFDAQYSAFVNGDSAGSLGGTLACTSNSSGTSLAGTYGIHCGGLSSINYFIHYVDGTLSVTNLLNAIMEIKGASPNSETLTIGQTDTLTATGKFTDATTRALSVAGGTSYAKAALSTPVSGAAMAEAGGVLYAIGGSDGANTVGTIQAYDPKNDSWTVLPNTVALGNPRTNAAVASAAGKIYVMGGKDANGHALSSIEVLDTTGANPVVSAYSASLSMARSAAGAAAFNNKLYVIGGSDNSNALSSVETFDLITGTTVTTDPGNSLAQASAAVVTKNNIAKLYVAGVSGSSIVLVNFDGMNWSSPVSTTLDASQGVGAASLGELLYMVNGADVWSYDGNSFVHKNSLGNAHNATQLVSIGTLIYAASAGSGSANSNLDAFAPDEVKWTSADAARATVDQSGKITAVAITSPTVAITGTSLSDSNISADFLLTIIKKTQTIQFDPLPGKTYGDADFSISTTSLDSTSTPTGLLVGFTAGSGDSCAVGASTLGAGVSSANVHITGAGNCTLTAAQPGDDTTWMAATSVSQNFTIAKTPLSVTADNANRFYGASNPSFTGNISGIKNSDNITATYASTATPTSVAGLYPIVPTLVDPDNKLGNYIVTSTNGTLTVKAVSITVTAYAKTKVYGDTDPTLTYKITSGSLFNGDMFSGSLTRAAGENVGDYAITQGSLVLSDNYILTYVGANLTIVVRPVTVTADGQTKVYGYNDPSLTYKITVGSLVAGDVFSGGLTRTAGENVGTYAIGLGSLVLSTNYNLNYVGANLVITARPITVTADGQTKVYGYNDPSLTYKLTVGSLVAGDVFSGGLTRAIGESVGTYAIGQGTLALSTNYNLNYVGANLVITARPITVTADGQTKVYGYNDPSLTYKLTVGSLVAGDVFSGGLTRAAGESVGTYTIGQGTLALSTNYNMNYVGANLVITARPIIVTADGQTKVYGYNDPTLTYMITTGTLVTGDVFSGGLTRAAGESVGTYTIGQGSLVLSTNYNLNYVGANLLITARAVTVTANPQAKLFGQPDPPLTFQTTVGSLVSSDTFAGGLVRIVGEAPGTYPILRGSLTLSSNYTLSYVGANLAIAQASTATSVSSSGSPSNWGQVVIFTATVSDSTLNSAGTPTGMVNFYNAASGATCQSLASANVLPLDTEPLVTIGSSQQASTSTPTLPVGNNTILACYNGDINFNGSNGTVPQTVVAAPIANLSPSSLSFGNQQGGTTSGPQTVSISNLTGTAPLLISSIKLAGTNPTYFTETDSCSNVAVGGSCVITVRFAPPATTTGVATAVLVVTDNDENTPGSTQSSLLTGAGTSSINSVGSLSTYGIFATANGCSSINMSGNAVVDSFNSASNNNGNVGTNGNVNLSGNPVVNGAVYSPITGTGNCSSKSMTGLSTSGKAQATGGLQALAGPLAYPAPPAPSPAPPTTAQNISGSCGSIAGCSNAGSKAVTLAPGQYGNLSISGGTTVNVSGGTYNVNSLTLSGNSALVVNSASGPVVVNLAGKSITGGNAVLDLTGGVMSNASGRANNLQFYYAGSQAVKLTGNTASYAMVYAPNAPVNLSGGSHFYGAMTGSTINNSGGTAIHYDASLPNIPQGDYIWFNSAALNVQGLPTSGSVKVYVTNASISFLSTTSQCSVPTISGRCTLPVPNAVITFSSTATTANTTWDATNNRWSTLVPTNGYSSLQTRAFIDGLAYLAPASFPAGIQNVTWSAAFSTSTPGLNFSWQWGAAVYTSFSSNYTLLNVNPIDGADPAGTPESYKNNLIFGAMGPGYVGLNTAAAGVVPTIAEASVSPSSLDFSNGGVINQTVGTASGSLTAVLTNNMSGPLTISSVQITGTNPGDFTQVNNCPVSPSTLASGGNCTIAVTFKPTGTNKRTAKIVVNDTANNSPQTVFLKGTGQ